MENNLSQIIGGLILAMLIGNVTLYAVNEGLKASIIENQKRIDRVESELIGKTAWGMLRDEVHEVNNAFKTFAEKNEADHDSIKAKLGRVNATLKAKR